jgi:hypothetical protein
MTFTRPLTALEKTNKIKRIKQGVTLYKVYAFPGKRSASIDVIKAAGSVKVKVYENGTFEYIPTKYGKKDVVSYSTKDAKLRYQTYNAHRTFFSLKKAKRYVKLIEAGCWPVYYKEPARDSYYWFSA